MSWGLLSSLTLIIICLLSVDHRWISPSITPDPVIQGPLVTFSFLLPGKEERVSYQKQQQLLKEAFENCPLFKDGLLLDTREKGGKQIHVNNAAFSFFKDKIVTLESVLKFFPSLNRLQQTQR